MGKTVTITNTLEETLENTKKPIPKELTYNDLIAELDQIWGRLEKILGKCDKCIYKEAANLDQYYR